MTLTAPELPPLPVVTRVTVFTKPNCVQCNATYRELDKYGIEYDIRDLPNELEALAAFKARNHAQAPIVMIPGEEIFHGFRPDLIGAHAATLEPAAA